METPYGTIRVPASRPQGTALVIADEYADPDAVKFAVGATAGAGSVVELHMPNGPARVRMRQQLSLLGGRVDDPVITRSAPEAVRYHIRVGRPPADVVIAGNIPAHDVAAVRDITRDFPDVKVNVFAHTPENADD